MVMAQFIYTLLTLIPAKLMYDYRLVNLGVLMLVYIYSIWYDARFSTKIYTRGCHWFPCLLA
jgi:hypothetical protein